jgi:hypothetical protein
MLNVWLLAQTRRLSLALSLADLQANFSWRGAAGFPRIGNGNADFSKHWKISRKNFRGLEFFAAFFPRLGISARAFCGAMTTAWDCVIFRPVQETVSHE